jgi:6-pyruvoyltetrahydropterin/6-carboxytetrahydropterin synthase
MTSPLYRVRVTKDHLVFSAGHFITFGTASGPVCERIHGHNWRVAVEVEGPLDANGYVFDFIALLDHSRAICLGLDHRMLLPDGSGLIGVEDEGANWRVTYDDRYWSFPKAECVVLPVPNTTTEQIARWFGERLIGSIAGAGLDVPDVVRVEVEENFGQTARAEWDRPRSISRG